MEPNSFTLRISNANIQFPPYCYLRPNSNYAGLSYKGMFSLYYIWARIYINWISQNQAIAECKQNIIDHKTREFTDWTERSKLIQNVFSSGLSDVILFQEVSRNHEYNLATLDDILEDSPYSIANYSDFTLKLANPKDQDLEKILKRGTAVVLKNSIKMDTASNIELTLSKNQGKKIQTRAASVATFTLNVLNTLLKVRVASVHITGFSPHAVKNFTSVKEEMLHKPTDEGLHKKYEKAQKSYEEFLEQYKEAFSELSHYLNELEKNPSYDLTLIGGDFNFDPISGDGITEIEELVPLTTTHGKEGLLQKYHYTVLTKPLPTERKRQLDYLGFKVSERVNSLFTLEVDAHYTVDTDTFLSDHKFVTTELTFTRKVKDYL